ncbi:hypothetical protein [Parasitella parasitica]|uniref:Uncharacterized protein n=1 Tax=Parasitella parasitica TaxID=35722 RepID=A0A0B7NVM0_9FUNG|nr:hypothetical protein [Parasitella parasitica]
MSGSNPSLHNITRAIDAIEEASIGTAIYNAETQSYVISEARKRRRQIEDEEEQNEQLVNSNNNRLVDGSDEISVVGHELSLMQITRTFGLSVYNKGFKAATPFQRNLMELCLNSIVDIDSNQLFKILDIGPEAHKALKIVYKNESLVMPALSDYLVGLFRQSEKLDGTKKRQHFVCASFDSYHDDKKRLEIIGSIYKNLTTRKKILESWRTLSEWSSIVKIWSDLFEVAFEETNVELIWGDTLNDKLKVDLRLCLRYENKDYDIANIEFKKNSKNRNLVVEDEVKVLIEGKSIANKLVNIYNMDFEESKKIKVLTGQIVGLRGMLKELTIVAPGAYVAQSFGKTIKYPISDDKLKLFVEQGLQLIFVFKDHVVREAERLKSRLTEEDNGFGSQSTDEDQGFLKNVWRVKKDAKKFPPVHEDIFQKLI